MAASTLPVCMNSVYGLGVTSVWNCMMPWAQQFASFFAGCMSGKRLDYRGNYALFTLRLRPFAQIERWVYEIACSARISFPHTNHLELEQLGEVGTGALQLRKLGVLWCNGRDSKCSSFKHKWACTKQNTPKAAVSSCAHSAGKQYHWTRYIPLKYVLISPRIGVKNGMCVHTKTR